MRSRRRRTLKGGKRRKSRKRARKRTRRRRKSRRKKGGNCYNHCSPNGLGIGMDACMAKCSNPRSGSRWQAGRSNSGFNPNQFRRVSRRHR